MFTYPRWVCLNVVQSNAQKKSLSKKRKIQFEINREILNFLDFASVPLVCGESHLHFYIKSMKRSNKQTFISDAFYVLNFMFFLFFFLTAITFLLLTKRTCHWIFHRFFFSLHLIYFCCLLLFHYYCLIKSCTFRRNKTWSVSPVDCSIFFCCCMYLDYFLVILFMWESSAFNWFILKAIT